MAPSQDKISVANAMPFTLLPLRGQRWSYTSFPILHSFKRHLVFGKLSPLNSGELPTCDFYNPENEMKNTGGHIPPSIAQRKIYSITRSHELGANALSL
jgi:hypothetical protein